MGAAAEAASIGILIARVGTTTSSRCARVECRLIMVQKLVRLIKTHTAFSREYVGCDWTFRRNGYRISFEIRQSRVNERHRLVVVAQLCLEIHTRST